MAYSKRATSLRIEPEMLGRLKLLALQQRKRVNDVILEAIEDYLAVHERHAA
jgi:predicted DNA-binding protein